MRRIEPVASADDLDIPMPAMQPAYRVSSAARQQGMDPATRRLALFAGVIGGSLLLLIGVWSFTGHRAGGGGVPELQAEGGPVRVKPANPGGMQVAGANEGILSGDTDGKAALAPPPETPQPEGLKPATPAPQAAAAPAPPAPKLAAKLADAAPKPAPVAEPRPAPTPAAAAETKTEAAKPASASGIVMVQLGSMDSEALAKAEWDRLSHKYGILLNGRRPTITKFDRSDNKTFWRLRTGGFADEQQAASFCAEVKAKGGACSVART